MPKPEPKITFDLAASAMPYHKGVRGMPLKPVFICNLSFSFKKNLYILQM